VQGRINGVRFRRNFKTKEEAAAEKGALELRALQGASDLHSVATPLAEAQVREAEAAFHRLGDRTRSLTYYLDYALSNYRDPMQDKPVVEGAREYLALREADYNQGHLSHRQFTSFRCELRALETVFRDKMVSELTAIALAEFFRRGQVSRKSYNNRRGLIGVFLKYCLQVKDWIVVNPIDKVPHHRGLGHRRGSASSLSAERCAEIMLWAEDNYEGRLVPFIALCLFAGIRPDLYEGEISKLEPQHVRLDMGVIHIEPEVSKVRMKRIITIQPNLAAWLRAYSEVNGLRVNPRQWRLVVCLVADHPPHFFDESRVRAAIGGTDPNECAGSKPKTLEAKGYLFKPPNSPDGQGDFLNIEQTWRLRVLKAGTGTKNGSAHIELVPGGYRQTSRPGKTGKDRAVPASCETMSYPF